MEQLHPLPATSPTKNKHKTKKAAAVNTAAALLKAHSSSLSNLKQIHCHILRSNLHHNPTLASLLLTLYSAAFSLPSSAASVFSSVPSPNLSLFNHAIRALSKSPPHSPHALLLYLRMTRRGLSPDHFTFPFLLSSAAHQTALPAGQELHSRLAKAGFSHCLPVANALVHMYGKCASLPFARQAFDEIPQPDLVSFNSILGAHARLGVDMPSAARLFAAVNERNVITWNAMIVGYVNAGDLQSARSVFDEMPARNVVSWSVLIMGYCRSGLIDAARALFDEMPQRNLVSWTVMIAGYSQCGRPREAVGLFRAMEGAGVAPDAATMTAVISAAAQLGSVELANWVGAYVDRRGIERNDRVLTALVDMHAKCGNVEQALRLFGEIPYRDAFAYTALICGLASHGHGAKALEIFHSMMAEAVQPDRITFVGVLSACSHAGLLDEGLRFWESMVRDHGIEHGPDHYACMVDMLSRAGRLKEAWEMAERMPTGSHAGALGAILAACRTYGDAEIAESVARKLFELEPENTGNYVLLSSIYAAREEWADAERVRKTMKERGMKKLSGSSWIERDRRRDNGVQLKS